MRIDDELIERLLYEEESDYLDFKGDQYAFVKASDGQKSELLKDILAFANSWRRTDAFILVGVREVKGGRSTVVGVTNQLDDAQIQEFVNSKTNRPVIFSYRNLTFEATMIAIIHIPLQQRPIFLKRDFGKLKGNIVYVKRGSSTGTADPDEVAAMGSLPQFLRQGHPELEIFFANPQSRTRLSSKLSISRIYLKMPAISEIPDYSGRRDPLDYLQQINTNYYKELAVYTFGSQLMAPIHIGLYNSGDAPAQDVRVEIRIMNESKLIILMDEYNYPKVPSRVRSAFEGIIAGVRKLGGRETVELHDLGAEWMIELSTVKVHSGNYCWFEESFYIGRVETGEIEMNVKVFADELSEPQEYRLVINVNVEQREIECKDILEMEEQRRATSRGQDA